MSNVTQWHGCYNDSWNGVITPDAFAHPAKYARGLIRRIYQHMLDSGYLATGDSVVDPFGGVALGGLDAMTFGLHWTGVELEPRFVELGQRNIEKWRRDLAMLNGTLGTARLLQGDSRRLLEVVGGGMGAAVSSPPYAESMGQGGESAIDITKTTTKQSWNNQHGQINISRQYGQTPGQLGSMRSGDFDAAISSPPYEGGTVHGDGNDKARHTAKGGAVGRWGSHATGEMAQGDYGSTPGQLGAMPSGDYGAAVSSPPYADAVNGSGEGPGARYDPIYHNGDNAYKQSSANGYGNDPANIGNDSGDTFWAASRAIVEQTYAALRPGGYAVWVTKRFVRNGAIVEFSEQWAQLCEAVGFTRVEWIRAMLVESHGEQLDIFGDSHKREVKRASFFRRLYEQKYPHNSIDWEDVIVMRKPDA